jgi:hypothetical protein
VRVLSSGKSCIALALGHWKTNGMTMIPLDYDRVYKDAEKKAVISRSYIRRRGIVLKNATKKAKPNTKLQNYIEWLLLQYFETDSNS